MFIRPVEAAVRPVVRPSGAPLLRGLLVGGPRPAKPAPAPEAPPGAPGPGDAELVDLLTQLGRLAQQGVLTPEEFAAAKARLLGL
ncbi:SHOCT domain-containing protein [Streptomyces sp. BPTC-684]|uniref:SHOCT domain-containing protein n=1 Tax=Streptomyces sp. BPTC-684 TaxID=3043734 RepID=UPI0024B0CB77|nr:SHOCT domain-containing protein [Streptomyces sp. BPTC-684]WHM36650.1 SHOCT domain-containing protein [Streptomyces sp. BPTC-684]